jgi:hypothetical protein
MFFCVVSPSSSERAPEFLEEYTAFIFRVEDYAKQKYVSVSYFSVLKMEAIF